MRNDRAALEMKPRFTVRSLMILAAAFGVVLGAGVKLARLSKVATEHLQDAAACASAEELARIRAQHHRNRIELAKEVDAGFPPGPEPLWLSSETDLAAKHERIAEYWAAMKEKHRRAALYPWQSVEPDPPPPE